MSDNRPTEPLIAATMDRLGVRLNAQEREDLGALYAKLTQDLESLEALDLSRLEPALHFRLFEATDDAK